MPSSTRSKKWNWGPKIKKMGHMTLITPNMAQFIMLGQPRRSTSGITGSYLAIFLIHDRDSAVLLVLTVVFALNSWQWQPVLTGRNSQRCILRYTGSRTWNSLSAQLSAGWERQWRVCSIETSRDLYAVREIRALPVPQLQMSSFACAHLTNVFSILIPVGLLISQHKKISQ